MTINNKSAKEEILNYLKVHKKELQENMVLLKLAFLEVMQEVI